MEFNADGKDLLLSDMRTLQAFIIISDNFTEFLKHLGKWRFNNHPELDQG